MILKGQMVHHKTREISLESRTMVLETADMLGEVTESVYYYVDGCKIVVGNLFGRHYVVQIYAQGVCILDGAYMTQELCIEVPNTDTSSSSDKATLSTISIADPYVLLKMSDGSIQLIVGDSSACIVSLNTPPILKSSADPIAACSLYHDGGPEPWLRKTSTDAWLSTGVGQAKETKAIWRKFIFNLQPKCKINILAKKQNPINIKFSTPNP